MTAPSATEYVVLAPTELTLDSREEFRRKAVAVIDSMRAAPARLVVDMRATQAMDSAGLGTLILVQRRAAARRAPVELRGLKDDLRFLLTLTKLEDLFEIFPRRS